MSYSIKGPELEGERGAVEVPVPPANCPLCGGVVEVTSDENGYRAWVFITCSKCGLRLMSMSFHIYYHCACDTFRQVCERLIAQWNKRV